MHALVLDGHLKSALAAVRSLGRAGIPVCAGALRETAMSLHSKYATDTFVYPSPCEDQAGFIRAVRDEASRIGGKPLVYAFSDATFLSLYTHRSELQDILTFSYPDEKSVEIAFDKAATYSLARVSGVPTIRTYVPDTNEELRRVAESLTYPAVLKMRRSITWKGEKGIFGSASFIQNASELEERFNALKERLGEAPLIQDLVKGEEYGVEILAEKGNVYARVAHHRIRSLSPTGGASVLKETLQEGELKHALVSHAEVLTRKLSWTGPLMVEFKVDADSRTPYLMEMNGRFWGSLPLSVHAGVDMPLLYYNATVRREIPSAPIEGRERVRSVHFWGDVLHLSRVLFARDPMRPSLYPRRMAALRDFIFPSRNVCDDVWMPGDLKPVWMEVVDMVQSRRRKR